MDASPLHSKQAWTPPQPVVRKNELKLWNSFTRQKVRHNRQLVLVSLSTDCSGNNSRFTHQETFTPLNGNRVTWYNCGPTVYDHSHMGHARSYITFDIIRRVLANYFNYEIFYVQNVTDIDDKIIRRARQGHLYAKYMGDAASGQLSKEKVMQDVNEALEWLNAKLAKETDEAKKKMMERIASNVQEAITGDKVPESTKEIVEKAKDVLADWLDSKFGKVN